MTQAKYKSQKERTTIAIRKKTKAVFKKKADKAGIGHIDFMDRLVMGVDN